MSVKVEIDVIKPATPSVADQQRRKVIYFVIANLIAVAVAAAIFVLLALIPEGARFDDVMGRVQRFLNSHMGVAALAASTPFFASLLVGQYEMRRARARRARTEATERRKRLAEEQAATVAAWEARRSIKH